MATIHTPPTSPTDTLAWAMFFRKYEPTVSDFINHLEWAGGKLSDAEVCQILLPSLKRLWLAEQLCLGPNFTGKPD